MIFKFRISPVGRTELVFAMRNQNGHDFNSQIPDVSHVFWLITLMLDPHLIIVLVTSLPLMITITDGLLVFTIVSPSLEFVKNGVVIAVFGGDCSDFRFLVNRGTNCNSLPKGNMI